MGILENAKPAIVICTRDRARSTAFYRDTLGLILAHEDNLAAVFHTGGATLRISTVPDFTPHNHAILGFQVPDVRATVQALTDRGITFLRLPHYHQDELGILTIPGTSIQVAWLTDPDNNVLSITNA